MKETLFNVNMHCAACKGNIENRLKKTKGIKDANANLVSSVVSVVYDENIINSTKIVEICRDIGYKCEPIEDEIELLKDEKSSKKEVIKLIVGVLILLPLMLLLFPQEKSHQPTLTRKAMKVNMEIGFLEIRLMHQGKF